MVDNINLYLINKIFYYFLAIGEAQKQYFSKLY